MTHLCDRFGLNGKYLSRLFKEAFGVKLVDFMVHVRIEESKRLLTQTSLSLQQIANAVGYIHDISYIRAFKKIEGVTPGDYRKSHTG
ncbi:HTH-type transcriptional regulator YesS [compost metagenome]